MQFSEKWLRESINPSITTDQLVGQLTMAGLEVDTVTPAAPLFSEVVVGHVVSTEPHPDADRLTVCKVDVGADAALDIVCGAPNVRANLKVAVVLVGGVVGDLKVKKAKLRGVTSHGMICSARELGLSDEHSGIVELPDDAPMGCSFREYLQLDDACIDVDLTPNRGDCASVRGIAREIAAINDLPLAEPARTPQPVTIDDTIPVKVAATEACPRYVGRVIRGVDARAETPIWMQERLRRSGLRSIHPMVDVTNYVMLELGQPLHAFDLGKLTKGLCVRMAKSGEKITLIDGKLVALTEQTLVIADDKQPQAIAGLMGGAASAVSDETHDIFLESAFFSPSGIARCARQYGLSTDSSYRFERGVDYNLQELAIERSTELILQIAGGSAGPIIERLSEPNLPLPGPILLRRDQIERLLGISIDDKRVEKILTSLGMDLKTDKDAWAVIPPSYRFDILQEVDLIEELVRLYGYDNIPSRLMVAESVIPPQSESCLSNARLLSLLEARSYHETITYSFVDEKLQRLLNPETESIALVNPIASDMNVMRVSLWPGLLKVLQYNQNRQIQRVRLFEIGLCFWDQAGNWQQVPKLAGLASGSAHSLQWGEKERPVDFYDVKGDVTALLNLTRRAEDFRWVSDACPGLHPGQSASLYLGERQVGFVGVLHPDIVRQLNLNQAPVLFEMALDAIDSHLMSQYRPLSKYPAVRRDIAIIVDKTVLVEEIKQKIKISSGHLLNTVEIFDIYAGEGIELGKKSVALGLTFQEPSRTLVDEEINQVIDRVVDNLEHEFNAKLRA